MHLVLIVSIVYSLYMDIFLQYLKKYLLITHSVCDYECFLCSSTVHFYCGNVTCSRVIAVIRLFTFIRQCKCLSNNCGNLLALLLLQQAVPGGLLLQQDLEVVHLSLQSLCTLLELSRHLPLLLRLFPCIADLNGTTTNNIIVRKRKSQVLTH